MSKEKEFKMNFYSKDEVKDLIKSEAEFYYVDTGRYGMIIKFEDIPDFIVDYNRNLAMKDLKFYSIDKDMYEPDITTMGEFLDRINPNLRERMIDRLIALQRGNAKLKEYKLLDIDVYNNVKSRIKENYLKRNKARKDREAR
ncbi:MAG: hypothetical protein IJH12_05120 [Clostridia bacterium]|nr:hypothetical protein [Clostridia bacterium]